MYVVYESYKIGGGGSEVLLLQKGEAEKVLAMLKWGIKSVTPLKGGGGVKGFTLS